MSDVNGAKQTRKEKAAATRRRIIAAAAEEFTSSGYHGTAMATIAKRAGYAVQTVYFVFHTKAELFAAALDTAVLGPQDKPPLDQDWARDALGDVTDPVATIRAFIRGGAQIYQRAAALSEVARTAAPTDPDAFAVYQSREELRIRGYRDFMALLADALPSGVDPNRAADILITMTSPQLYLAFRHDRGWSHDQTVDWMMATIPNLVLRS
ncbi:MAG: TetR/AcrR family transcriptional regulator [Dermatophilaceae bacterium]